MREALLGVAVGKKGIGKTFTTLQIIDIYVKGSSNIAPRRALILDVNDEFENIKAIKLSDVSIFSMHPKIEARRIRPFNSNGSKMTLDEIAMTLLEILETFRGGLLLIEDVNRYISDYFQMTLLVLFVLTDIPIPILSYTFNQLVEFRQKILAKLKLD